MFEILPAQTQAQLVPASASQTVPLVKSFQMQTKFGCLEGLAHLVLRLEFGFAPFGPGLAGLTLYRDSRRLVSTGSRRPSRAFFRKLDKFEINSMSAMEFAINRPQG